MAAFALGLIGDRSARDPLVAALDRSVAAGEGQRRRGARPDRRCRPRRPIATHGVATSSRRALSRSCRLTTPTRARDTPAAAFRLGDLRARPAEGVRRARGGRARRRRSAARALVAGRLRAAAARGSARRCRRCWRCVKDPQPYTRAFAAKGLGAMKDRVGGRRTAAARRPRHDRRRGDRSDPRARPTRRRVSGAGAAQASCRAPKTDPHLGSRPSTALGALRARRRRATC